jgi:hypothetical protein
MEEGTPGPATTVAASKGRNRMTSARLLPISLALVLLSACSRDPHKLLITEKNKDSFLDEIKDEKGLTVDEVRLLVAYQIRGGIAKAFGGQSKNPAGKTVAELIDDARKDAAAEKTAADNQKRLADEAKVKEEAAAAELRKALNLTVFAKGFQPANAMAGVYGAHITVKCAYENMSGKDIRAFKGTLVFQDLFDVPIYKVAITISDPIKTGEHGKWDGAIEYNQFIAAQTRFRNAELKDMHVVWMPSSIIFTDGAKIGE